MSLVESFSIYVLPAIILIILISGFIKGNDVFDIFTEGAKSGVETMLRILPPLLGLMVAVGVFRASGALDIIVSLARPVASAAGIPSEVLPLAFLRPISGSASLALVSDIMKQYGPDSAAGRTASVMMGSTETIFYTLTVYFGSAGIKKTRYTLAAALLADAASVLASSWICGYM